MFRPTIAAILFALPACAAPVAQGGPNAEFRPAFAGQTRAEEISGDTALRVETFAAGLSHPWGIAPLPGGGWLVTERPGRMRHVSAEGRLSAPIAGLPEVLARRQGGLLDVTVSPDFARDRLVYWTYAKPLGGGLSATAAARGRLSEDLSRIEGATDIFVHAPGSPTPAHYGSRILFGPSGHVFIVSDVAAPRVISLTV